MNTFISRAGLICKKLGMTNMIIENKFIPVTLIEVPANYIIEQKQQEDFAIVKLGVVNSKNVKKPQVEELKKKEIPACSIMKEFKVSKNEITDDKSLDINYIKEWSFVDVTGVSSGKGFAGCMKKWNFKGNRASHGASLSHRSIGSTGVRDKGWKGKKMPGRMGGEKITVQSLKVVNVDTDLNVVAVLGCIPGKSNSWISVRKAIKKAAI